MVFGRVPIGCSLRNSTPALLLQIGQTQILWPPAKWHTLCPPHSILFILGAVSPADEAAVLRERDLLQLRDHFFLRWLAHTSVITVCAAPTGHPFFEKRVCFAKPPAPPFFKRALRACLSVFSFVCIKPRPPSRARYRKRQKTALRVPEVRYNICSMP